MDLLRQRRARRGQRGRLPADLPRADADGGAVVGGAAQDDPHQQGQPDHLDRRLHRRALRQEHGARRAGHGDRGGGRDPVHRAAAQGRVDQLPDPAAVSRGGDAAQGAGRGPVQGHGAVRGAAAGRVHAAVRHAPPRRHRAARGHGRGDRLRVGGQAAVVPRRRRLRDLLALRRVRRRVRPGAHAARHRGAADAGRRGRHLRVLGLADLPVDALHPVPAATVPDQRGRERQREPPGQGDLAVPRLPVRDQRLRAADHLRGADAVRRRADRCRHLRADAADGARARGAGTVRVHRRPVGRHRHGDRRDHRAVDDDLQRPGDAGAAALETARAGAARRPVRAAAGHPARRDRAADDAGLRLLPARRRGVRAGVDRAGVVRRGGAVRAGHARRQCTGSRARRPAR